MFLHLFPHCLVLPIFKQMTRDLEEISVFPCKTVWKFAKFLLYGTEKHWFSGDRLKDGQFGAENALNHTDKRGLIQH